MKIKTLKKTKKHQKKTLIKKLKLNQKIKK